jgi:hypothetical protein
MPGNANSGGRNRQSTAAHVLRGTFKPSRHGGSRTSTEAPPGRPDKPKDLDALEARVWDRFIADLETQHTLTSTDGAQIKSAVLLSAEVERSRARRREFGVFLAEQRKKLRGLEGPERDVVVDRIIELESQIERAGKATRLALKDLRPWLDGMGLTTVSRARVNAAVGAGLPAGSVAQFKARKPKLA